jgi:hypothetical protein
MREMSVNNWGGNCLLAAATHVDLLPFIFDKFWQVDADALAPRAVSV